jgi:hypothetical protein
MRGLWGASSRESGVVIREKGIKLALGEMRGDEYLISLYYFEPGVEAIFAAGFGSSTRIEHLSNAHRVELAGGRTRVFRPVSRGGSCAPASSSQSENQRRSTPMDDRDQPGIMTAFPSESVITFGGIPNR